MSEESLDKANRLASIVQPGGELAGGEIHSGFAIGPELGAKVGKPLTPPASLFNRITSAPMRAVEKVGKVAAPYLSATGKVLNPALRKSRK